ncbi:Cation diffusion facilitator family transporter, variant 2 [Balamuthia mandrillaris]
MSKSGSWLRAGRSQRLGFVGTFATAGVGASYGGQTRRLLHRQQQRYQKPPLIPSICNLHSAQYVRAIAPLSALPLNPPARRKSHFFPLHQSYSANKPSAYSNRQCLQAFDQRRTFVSWFAEGKRKKKEEKKKKKERATTDFTSPSPSSSDEESPSDDMNARTVYAAMGANIVLTLAKFGGAWATGSASLLSEGVHSLGDCFNQGFLAIGIRNSKRKPDEEHPYGYGRETFIWALISACGVFFVGSGVTLYHGVSSLITGGALTSPSMALSILGLSFLLEGATFTMALRAVRAGATEAGLSMKEYLLRGSDPLAVAVLIEDGAAVKLSLSSTFHQTQKRHSAKRWQA